MGAGPRRKASVGPFDSSDREDQAPSCRGGRRGNPRAMPNAEKKREVIELERYRKAAAQRAAQKPPPPPRQGLLGGRRHAGVLLILVLAACALVYFLPRLL
ncbi:MAG: hypothetical protein JWO33_2424 [Caulobacteraceae bacterium]|nr:hypothetical protein [Caulobacteraceae bacterium]